MFARGQSERPQRLLSWGLGVVGVGQNSKLCTCFFTKTTNKLFIVPLFVLSKCFAVPDNVRIRTYNFTDFLLFSLDPKHFYCKQFSSALLIVNIDQ